jgi:hypothetical protein
MKDKLMCLLLVILVASLHTCATAADTKVGGEIYSFFTTDLTDNGQGKGYSKFDLSRVYITIQSKLSDQVSVRITADVNSMDGSARELYLKYAYLDWDVSRVIPYSTLRFGLQQSGWIDYMNKVWGRRYVAKTLMDEYKALSSADYGISHLVKFPKGYGHGAIQILQGPGYKGKEENRYKDISAFVFLRPLIRIPDLAASMVGGYYYKGFSDQPDITSEDRKDRLAALVSLAYAGILRVSGEYFESWDRMAAKSQEDLEKDGISIFGDVKFPMAENSFLKRIALVGRYDRYDPSKDAEDDQKTYLIAGVECEVLEGFNIMPNFQRAEVEGEDAEDSFVVNALFKF